MTDYIDKYITPFVGVGYVHDVNRGIIVWREGTGNNVELLHLRVYETRKGHATSLVREMLTRIDPYYSVFVFFRKDNEAAYHAYKSFGFTISRVSGLYKHGGTCLGTATYRHLCETLGVK